MRPISSIVWTILLAWLVVSPALAAERRKEPRQITGLAEPIPSPDGRFELFYRKDDTKGKPPDYYPDHEIWIRSKMDPAKSVLVYSYGRGADVLWSPDSKMVAITDFAGSSESYVVIFRISPQLVLEAIPEVEPFIESHEKQMLPAYDHFYAEVVRWSEDSKSLTINLRGDFTEWDLAQTERRTQDVEKQVIFKIRETKD